MVNTSDRAELQNSITNVQNVITELSTAIDRITDQREKKELKELTNEASTLLHEANQRCNKLL